MTWRVRLIRYGVGNGIEHVAHVVGKQVQGADNRDANEDRNQGIFDGRCPTLTTQKRAHLRRVRIRLRNLHGGP